MPVVVTQLIVDASGATTGVAAFEAAMTKAKAAAVDGGVATATAFEKAQQRWNTSLAATDPVIKAQIAQAQALSRQQNVNTDAVKLGITTQEAAAAQLDKVRQKHDGIIQSVREQTGQLTTNEKAWQGIKNATSGVSGQLIAMSAGAGPVGVFLSALGPWGLAAAVGIGAVSAAFNHMISEANRMADGAGALRTFSETTMLSISQIKALGRSGAELGVGTDAIAASVEKFTINMEEARKSSGTLYDAVRLIDGGLAKELSATTTTAQAWDVLAKARNAASDQSKNALSKAAFGKGGVETGLVLDVTAEAGGLDAIVARQQKINGLNDDAIKKWATTKIQIDEAQKRTANLMASTYTQDVLDRMLQAALLEERVTRAIISGTAERQKSVAGQYDPLGNFTPGAATPASPLETAKSNLGAGLSAGQKPDLSGYDAMATKIWSVIDAEKAEQDQRKKLRDAAISDSNLTKEEIGYLGTAATADERRTLRLKELLAARLSNTVSEVAYNRAVSAVNLDTAIAKQSAHNSVLGGAATITDVLNEKMLVLAKARQQDPTLTQKQIDTQLQITAAQNSGIFAINGQIDAENVKSKVLFMSEQAALAYTVSQTEINRQLAAGRPLQDINVEGIRAAGAELARTTVAANRYSDALQTVKDGLGDVGKAALSSALQGKLGMDSLVSTLDSVAKKLSDKAFDNLISLDPDKMIIGAAQAGASAVISLFTGDQKAKQELEKSKQLWAGMTMQVVNFDIAAKGFNLGPLTNALQSLYSTSKQLQDAALKAKDSAGAASAANAFNNAVDRIFNEFKNGTQTLTPLETSIKAVRDEAAGLKDTLDEIGFKGRAGTIDAIVQQQIDALTKQFNATFISGLTARLNTATGQTFLNDAANLLVQHQQDLTQAGELGNDPTLLAQVAETFHKEAQKIVDDAGLVGSAFTDFTKQFPDLAGIVVQANQDMSASAKQLQDQMNQSAKTIVDFVNGLFAGSNSTLSPTQQLASAQLSYDTKLGLAQGGNADALGSITTDAQNLLTAARAVYASSTGYQSIFQNVTSQLLNLPAVQNTTDPAVQAMRDVLTAINIGNAALNVINATAGGTTGAVNSGNLISTNQILPAVNAGNAAAVAGALQTYFNQIDPSGRLGSLITITGLTSDRTGNISDYTLATVTNTLGTNGGVAANNTLTGTGNTTLDAIKGLQNTATGQLVLMTAAFDVTNGRLGSAQNVYGNSANVAVATSTTGVVVQNQMVQALNKIVWNTFVIANNTSLSVPQSGGSGPGHLFGTYAQGGVIPAYGLGLVSEHLNPTFLRAGQEPITVSPFPAQIPFNDNRPINVAPPVFRGGGGSNADLIAAIARLEARLDRIEGNTGNTVKAVVATGTDTVSSVRAAAKDICDEVEDSAKRGAFAVTQAAKDKKRAA